MKSTKFIIKVLRVSFFSFEVLVASERQRKNIFLKCPLNFHENMMDVDEGIYYKMKIFQKIWDVRKLT